MEMNKCRSNRPNAFPIYLRAAETWTIKADNRGIDAFQTWAYSRMLRVK